MRSPLHLLLPSFLLLAAPASADILEGVVAGPGGTPLEGVDLDVFNQATGQKLAADDTSDPDGTFTVVLPPGTYRVGFDPTDVSGPTLAPLLVPDVVVAGTVDIGTVTLVAGFELSGTVTGPGGGGLAGIDLDVRDAASGEKLFTPGDNTEAGGDFSLAVPPGTYFVEVEPLAATRLLAADVGPITVVADIDLGTISLATGVWLQGHVTSATGGPVTGCDVDVENDATNLEIPLSGDKTDASGAYLVVVPTGILDVDFSPPVGSGLGDLTVQNVTVSGDTLLDATLLPGSTDPVPTPIALGNTFLGSFSPGSMADEVRFEAVAGLLASFQTRGASRTVLPDLALLAPSGSPVPLSAFSTVRPTGVKVRSLPLPETGLYRVVLYPLNAAAGPYSLKTTFKAAPGLKKVAVAGQVPTAGATVDLPFVALAGGTLGGKILASGSGLDPTVVSLLAPSGAPVSLEGKVVSKPGVSCTLLGVSLPEPGTYTLRVGGVGSATGSFTGTLKLRFPKPIAAVVDET
ncbi:MAG: carboxypeptidase-like regulatory domain-containing protein [Planctomycetes bacterium]|nr:carboxypeptidase-like regulatory domain-containing protein [Planctomycetota bacterium]